MPTYRIEAKGQARFLPEQSSAEKKRWCFEYVVEIVNTSTIDVQVISQQWVIHDPVGGMVMQKSLKLNGVQPLLRPGQRFIHKGSCVLHANGGCIYGSYLCVTEDAVPLPCPVPLMMLDATLATTTEGAGAPIPGSDNGGGRVLH